MYEIPDSNAVTSEKNILGSIGKLFDRHEDPMIRAAAFNGQSSIQLVEDTAKIIKERLKVVEDFNKEFTEEDERTFMNLCSTMFQTRRVWKELDDEMEKIRLENEKAGV